MLITAYKKANQLQSSCISLPTARDAKRGGGAKGTPYPGPHGLDCPFRFKLAIICL